MAGSTTPELVASVSNSGGLGTIGAGYFNTQQLEDEIDYVPPINVKFFWRKSNESQNLYTSSQIRKYECMVKTYRRLISLQEEPVVKIIQAATI